MIIGEVLSMAVLFRVTANMNEKESFAVAGASGLAFAVLIALMVTEKDKLVKGL
jgi:membrane associated rhomboid family serine protease